MTHDQKTMSAQDFTNLIKDGVYDFRSYEETTIKGLVILPPVNKKERGTPDLHLGKLIFEDLVKFSRSNWRTVTTVGARFETGINLGASRVGEIHLRDSAVKEIFSQTLDPLRIKRNKTKSGTTHRRRVLGGPECRHLHVSNSKVGFISGQGIRSFTCDEDSTINEMRTCSMTNLRLGKGCISILHLDQPVCYVELEHGFVHKTVDAKLNQKAGYLIAFFAQTGVSLGKYPEELLEQKLVEQRKSIRRLEHASDRSNVIDQFDRSIRMYDPSGLSTEPRFKRLR